MPDPKGNLVTPVALTAAGKLKSLLCDDEGRLLTVNSMHTAAKARAYLSADQDNIANTTWTKVLLDVATFDPSTLFGGNQFTVKVAGYYLVIGAILWDDVDIVADKVYLAALYKNAVNAATSYNQTAVANYLTSQAQDIIHCDVDDTLSLWAYHEAGVGTIDIFGASQYTNLSIHLLSAD